MIWTLQRVALRGGIYQGLLTGTGPQPELVAEFEGSMITAPEVATVSDAEGEFSVRLELPNDLLAEGLQTVVIREKVSGDVLDTVSVLAGLDTPDDIRVEVQLLRAELELLKRAFRRHITELG